MRELRAKASANQRSEINVPELANDGFYRFVVTAKTPVGDSKSVLIHALPIRRCCGFTKSFLMLEDGPVFFTAEDRYATVTDARLE